MPRTIEDVVIQRLAQGEIRYVPRPDLSKVSPSLEPVVEQARREFQLAPPLTLHWEAPELFAGLWSALREVFIVGEQSRRDREMVATAVSEQNQCAYCATVHGALVTVDERHLRQHPLYWWARARYTRATSDQVPAPFSETDAAQFVGTVLVFHYLNRMVRVFLPSSPVRWPIGRSGRRAAMRWLSGRMLRVTAKPGEYTWRPDEDFTTGELWSVRNAAVDGGMGRLYAAVKSAGSHALTPSVRHKIQDHLRRWRGQPPPLDMTWVDELFDGHAEPAGRLALLTARAPERVTPELIAEVRKLGLCDAGVVRTAAWGAGAAMRRVASWAGTGVGG